MKTIIAGSRDITDYPRFEQYMQRVLDSGWTITEVVSGTCRGVDQMGERWAGCYGFKHG